MATGSSARLNIGNLKINNILTIESHQPAKRTDKLVVQICPMHIVREIQTINQALQGVAQQINSLATLFMNHSINIAILGNQLLRLYTLTTGKALSCLSWVSICIKGNIYSRAAVFLGKVCLLLCQALYQQGTTARSTQSFNILVFNTQLLKGLSCIFLQLGQDSWHYMSWNLLSTDF